MKVSNVKAYVLNARESSEGAPSEFQSLVRIETDNGLIGWGEACVHSEHGEAAHAVKTLIERGFRQVLMGEDPLAVRKLWDKMYEYSFWYGRSGLVLFAMSVVDLALMDIAGKSLDVPAYVLLGGQRRGKVEAYATMTFDMNNPGKTAEVARKLSDKGFTGIKCGWGITPETSFGLDLESDAEALRQLRAAIGNNVRQMVEVGRFVKWNAAHALKAGGSSPLSTSFGWKSLFPRMISRDIPS